MEKLKNVHPFFGMSFLAFKLGELPIRTQVNFQYSYIRSEILVPYYKLSDKYDGFYNPFRTSNPKNRWVSSRYDSTSLQRITADTFGEAFYHDKGQSMWAWKEDYTSVLKNTIRKTKTDKVPIFDLAVWIFKDVDLTLNFSESDLIESFVNYFHISPQEMRDIFDAEITSGGEGFTVEHKASRSQLFEFIGWPPGSFADENAILTALEISHVGPSEHINYEAAPRLNIITGDNSLGKTFLTECIWWALTGNWARYPADPGRRDSLLWHDKIDDALSSRISVELTTPSGRTTQHSSTFDIFASRWRRPVQPYAGLAIYSQYDGGISIWAPLQGSVRTTGRHSHLLFAKEEIWDGKSGSDAWQRKNFICNGLIRDWVTWQTAVERYGRIFEVFMSCLEELSPSTGEVIRPGKSVRLPGDSREIPTIKMSYGDVPVIYASAGIQKILSLAYILVWTWFEHIKVAQMAGQDPDRQIVVILDEIEAHLHPRWQRRILPSILKIFSHLSNELQFQLHISTHSPLILASVEPHFDSKKDALHHLRLVGRNVELVPIEFVKHGTTDSWLISDIFGLETARSLPAEQAILEAKQLQISGDYATSRDVIRVHNQLLKLLADDDPFWVRWNFFAKGFLEEQ